MHGREEDLGDSQMCSPEGSSGPGSGRGDCVSCTSIHGREDIHGESQMCSPEGSSGPGSGRRDCVSCTSIHGREDIHGESPLREPAAMSEIKIYICQSFTKGLPKKIYESIC
jgi:hypothetical protein